MKRRIRLTENDLHRIVNRSVKQVLREGLFGNDAKYGEKWYNPFSWKSDSEKRSMDRKSAAKRQDEEEQAKQQRMAKYEKEAEESNKRAAQYAKEYSKSVNGRPYGGDHYASHAGETYYGIGHSAYDDMGR